MYAYKHIFAQSYQAYYNENDENLHASMKEQKYTQRTDYCSLFNYDHFDKFSSANIFKPNGF